MDRGESRTGQEGKSQRTERTKSQTEVTSFETEGTINNYFLK